MSLAGYERLDPPSGYVGYLERPAGLVRAWLGSPERKSTLLYSCFCPLHLRVFREGRKGKMEGKGLAWLCMVKLPFGCDMCREMLPPPLASHLPNSVQHQHLALLIVPLFVRVRPRPTPDPGTFSLYQYQKEQDWTTRLQPSITLLLLVVSPPPPTQPLLALTSRWITQGGK